MGLLLTKKHAQSRIQSRLGNEIQICLTVSLGIEATIEDVVAIKAWDSIQFRI